jgi:hypothetical protein
VVDPKYTAREVSRENSIEALLRYYGHVAYLAGFWRMGDLLSNRAEKIKLGTSLADLERKDLDYENVLKFGGSIGIRVGNFTSRIFFPKGDDFGFRHDMDGYQAFFAMEERLVEILTRQDYEALQEYNVPVKEDIEADRSFLSVANDGSILMLAPNDLLPQRR